MYVCGYTQRRTCGPDVRTNMVVFGFGGELTCGRDTHLTSHCSAPQDKIATWCRLGTNNVQVRDLCMHMTTFYCWKCNKVLHPAAG